MESQPGGPQQRSMPAEPFESAMNFMLLQNAISLQPQDTQQNSSGRRGEKKKKWDIRATNAQIEAAHAAHPNFLSSERIGELLQGMAPRDFGSVVERSPHFRVRQPGAPTWSGKRPDDLHLCEELVVKEDKALFHLVGSSDPYHPEGVADLYLATAGGEVLLRASFDPRRESEEIIVRRAGSDMKVAYVQVDLTLGWLGREVDRKIRIESIHRIGGEHSRTFAHVEQAGPGKSGLYHVRHGHQIQGRRDKMLAIRRTTDDAVPSDAVLCFYHFAPLAAGEEGAMQVEAAKLVSEGSGLDLEETYWQVHARHRLIANLEDFGHRYTARRQMQVRRGTDLVLIFCATIGVYKLDEVARGSGPRPK